MIARIVSFALSQRFLIVMASLMLMIWGAGLVPEAAHRRLSRIFRRRTWRSSRNGPATRPKKWSGWSPSRSKSR